MKRTLFFLVLGLLLATTAKGQIKIGDNPQTIDPSSVLELESGSRVLVVTRVSTAEMNTIIPLPGAVVYNTDLQCIHYYNGTEWINVCEEVGGIPNLTTEPLINTRSTIVITTNGEDNHIEVAPNSIRTEQIVDGGINGDDIQDNSIGQNKIGNDAVGANELEENAVGVLALNNVEVEDYLSNTVGYITSTDIVSGDGDNAILIGLDGGAYYDDTAILTSIQDNTDALSVNTGDILSNALNIGSNTTNIGINATAIADHIDDKDPNVLLGTSDDSYPTQNAVKTYVDNATGAVSTLNNGTIYVGNASNVATGVAMGGDATITNTGVVTIANNAITTGKINNSAVTTAKINNGAVTNAKIANNAINTDKIQNGTVGNLDLDKTSIPLSGFGAATADVDVGGNKLINVDTPTNAQDAVNKAYVDAQVSGVGGTGDITSTDLDVTGGANATFTDVTLNIKDNAITSSKIALNTIIADDINTGAVTTDEILNGTILAEDIADANVTEAKINPSTTNGEVLTTVAGVAQWTAPTAGVVLTTTAIDGNGQAGTPLDIADDAITSSKIALNTIIADDINTGAVTTDEILNGTILAEDIADANVTEAKINPSTTNGEVLTTVAGVAQWTAPTAGVVLTTTAIDGNGQAGTPLDIADDAITSSKIA
ncbi:hypothetical protein HPE56_18830, partial [Maribacter sp. ANRC-HE7]